MLSKTFKHDLNEFIYSTHTVADFMVFLKHHPEARNILKLHDGDYHFLEFMSEEEIHHEYDRLIGGINNQDSLNYDCALDCLIHAMEEDLEVLGEAEEFVRGFSVLLDFKVSIPTVCNIRIGNENDGWWHNAVQEKSTGDYDFDQALSEYGAIVDCELDYGDTIKEILITLPFCDWSYENIKALYAYISKKFHYENRKASYSFDNYNDFSDVDIILSNSLYDISVYKKDHYGREYLKIKISQKQDDATIYQALNTLAFSDELDQIVTSTIKEILFNSDVNRKKM